MKVWFIGAGPGDPDLITVKAQRLIETCKVCLYAGSLVPEAIVAAAARKDASGQRHRPHDAGRDHGGHQGGQGSRARTSPASIPATPRCTAPSPNRSAD